MDTLNDIDNVQFPELADEDNSLPTEEDRARWQLDKRWALFMNPRIHGTCFNPWQFLKVDIFHQTKVCSTGFGHLPEFEFLPAKEFLSERAMWNHPFMQHMREHDGSEDEVPYCGFCQGRYRPDLPQRSSRRLSQVESQKLLQDKMDEAADFTFEGRISSLDEDLSSWSFPLRRKGGQPWSPFGTKRQFYRREIRLSGFQNIGAVVQLGSSLSAYAPFLREPSNTLTVVDWQTRQLENIKELIEALDLTADTITMSHDGSPHLPFPDGSVAGVWLDAHRWMDRFSCVPLFAEIRRILRPGGVVRIVRAPSAGALIMRIANTTTDQEARALIDGLRHETKLSGPSPFFTVETVYRTMKRMGFAVSKQRPPQMHVAGQAFREVPELGRDLKQIADKLECPDFRARLRDDTDLQDGLEMAISLNVSRR